jgi:glutathione-regulated potassium-efflux system ancillary protein KefC
LREIFTSVSLALIVGITLLMQLIGISPALGAFVAGVVLANSHYKHTLETDIEPFKGLLLGLFFISVGMGIDFILLKEKFLWLLLAVATLIVVKFIVIYALARLFRFTNLMAIGFGLTLAQGGEFAFVLFQYAGNFSIIPKENSDFLTLIVALSILFTPLIMVVFERVSAKFAPKAGDNTIYDKVDEQNSIIIAGFGRFGQIIGRFLIANGIKVTILEKNPDQIELLRKFNIQGYFGDATRLDLLESAKAAQAKILIVAVDDVQAGLDIVALARDHFPHLKIFARARNRRHAYELDRLGVDVFKREVFESALSLAQDLMLSLGRNEEEIAKKINEFRRHDEETLRNSFSFMDDESQLINFTKMRRTELEAILQGDNAQIKAK